MLDQHYGITGYGVSSPGKQNLKEFLPKNQHAQRKLSNWTKGELQKSKFLKLIILIFHVKI
jgi:hypothetical protein